MPHGGYAGLFYSTNRKSEVYHSSYILSALQNTLILIEVSVLDRWTSRLVRYYYKNCLIGTATSSSNLDVPRSGSRPFTVPKVICIYLSRVIYHFHQLVNKQLRSRFLCKIPTRVESVPQALSPTAPSNPSEQFQATKQVRRWL